MKTKITLLSLFTFFIFITNVSGQCWQSISTGYQTGAAIRPDGSLWTWGWNALGQLGLGNTTNTTVPTKVGTATWQMVSMGSESTSSAYGMAIQTDGTLWGWGGNGQGELGIGNNVQQNSPVKVGTATNWKYIYAGSQHTVAIKTDGTLWTWGRNQKGQLGIGTTASRLTPIQVGTATDWKMASSGSTYTIAIKTDGTLWAWGENSGAFGNGLTTDSTTPIQIGTETGWQSISRNMGTTLAIKTNGTLWAWGANFNGQLGNGTTTDSGVPIQIGAATWQSVFSGFITSFGIKTDGTLWGWGDNDKGELGDNTIVDKLVPTQIGTSNNWASIAPGFTHTLGLKTDGAMQSWGANQISQLGLGNTTEFHVPTSVACYTGCTTAVEGLFPTTTFTPVCSGSVESITADAWAGEYSNVNVLANRSYTFRSSVSTDFITITNAAATVIYASGTTPVSWVSNNAEVIRYFLNTNSSCGTQQTSRTRSVTCTDLSCNAPTGLAVVSVTTTSGTISWTAASPAPASGYDYYYSTSNTAPTASTTVSGNVAAGVLSKSITGLTTGVTYYFWVRSKCTASTTSAWAAGGSFVPQTNPPCLNGTQYPTSTFTPACSGSQETIITNAWGGEYTVVNVLANKVYTFASSVSTDYITISSSDGATIYATGTTPVTWISNAVSGTIKYYFHTGSGCGTLQVSRNKYITCADYCGGPANLAAVNISSAGATLSWTAPAVVPGVDYQYYISTSSTSPTAATTGTSVSATAVNATLSNLYSSTVYYYWVRSRCSASSVSSWVAGGSFVTQACDGPTNVTTNIVRAGNADISWTPASVAPTYGYEYYYNTTGILPVSVNNLYGVSPGANTTTIYQLSQNTTYYYWVRSRCGINGASSWVSGGSFTTLTCDPPSNVTVEYVSYTVVEIDYVNPANLPSSYDYYVSTVDTVPTASTVPTGGTGNTNGYKYIYDLTQSTTYYAWLRSSCGVNSKSEWVSTGSFTTLTCESIANFSINNITSSTAQINWNIDNQYDDMEYYYNTTGVAPTAATTISGASIYGEPTIISGLNYSTTYYVWGRKVCGTNSKGPWIAGDAPFTTQTGNSIVGSFVNNTTGSTTSYNQSDSVTFTFTLEFPAYWPASSLYAFAYSYDVDAANALESPFNGPFNASSPASALTLNPNGTYSITLSPVSSYFPNRDYMGRIDFAVKTYNGSMVSTTNYATFVSPIPAPSANDQLFCISATVADLVVGAANPKWYTVETGGTALATIMPLTTGVYYVSQVINGSESIARNKINVTVNTVSVTPATSNICGNEIQALTVNANINDPVLKLGSGTYSNYSYTPYQGYWGGARTQAIYTASELSALGLHAGSQIKSVGYKLTTGIPIQLNNFTVKAGFTTEAVLNSYIQSPDYTVFTEAAYIPATGNGNIDYTLAIPLTWDGTSNLLIETCYNNNNSGGTYINTLEVESTEVIQLYKHIKLDNNANVCTTTSTAERSVRPNLRIRTVLEPVMTWSPVTGLYTDAAATIPYVAGDSRAIVYAKPTAYTVYTSTVTATGCTTVNTVTVDAHFTPAPESSKQYFCMGATVANLVAAGSNIKWYDAEGNLLNASAVLQTGVYFVSQTAHGCESEKAAVSVIVNSTPVPTVADQAFCSEATVSDLVAIGTDLKWYDASNHILASFEAIHTGTYYVSQTGHGCESEKAMVSVTIHDTAAPTASNQTFCNTAMVSDLIASGTNIKWYDASNHILSASDTLENGIYFVTQTLNSCESDRTMITVTVNFTSAPVAENQTFCNTAFVSDLMADGSDIKWYNSANTLLTSTAEISTGTYYVSQTAHGCESEKTAVSVVVNHTSAPVAANQVFCDATMVSQLIAEGTDIKWYDNDHILLSPETLLESGIYYVSQTAHGCESEMTTVLVTINDSTTSEETATACDSYEWQGEMLTESGEYTLESTNASGCTHTETLYLTINHSTTSEEEVTACDSYEWNGETYTESGDYTHTGTNASGCTDIVTLHLTVNHTAAPTASSQSFCSGIISELMVTGTDIRWYHTASGGTALAGDTALETGTYYVTQTISGCESARTAVSVTIQVAMPSAPSPQVLVCGARRTSLSATGTNIRWYTTATGGTAMGSSDLLTTGTYYVTQTIGTCQGSRLAVQVIINNIAAPTASGQTFCYNGTVGQLTATGTDLRWYSTETGGTPLLMATQLMAGTYYVSQKLGTCESGRTPVQVTLSGPALPEAPSPQTFNCGARRTSLVATGTGLKWYTTATGGTAILSSTQLVTGSYYVSQTISGCEGPRREVAVTIIMPTAPTASTQYFCTATTVASLYASGTNIKWYATDTDTTPLASTTPLVTATYYASQTNSMMCESIRTGVQVVMGGAPMPEAPSPQTLVCGSKRPSLVATGTGLLWYTVPTGGTALSSTAVLVTGTYYVTQNVSGCVSARRAVSVMITNPDAPAATAQTLCSGATVANLTATGTNLAWYSSASGGTALAMAATVVSGTYYVSQGGAACESARTAVSVTINTTPMPDAPSPQVFSCNVKRPSLVATGTGLLWYTAPTGGTALSSTAQLATGTYYVSQTIDGCTSARRAVSVSVNATAPPSTSDQTHCNGSQVSSLTATGTALKWYTSASGGTALATTAALTAGTYYVSQTQNGCESLRSAANVTLMSCAVKAPEQTTQTPEEGITLAYGITVYPNPTSSILNIKAVGGLTIDRVIIIDSAGRVVLEQSSNATQVDVARFARGVYILQAFSKGKQFQAKFVKE